MNLRGTQYAKPFCSKGSYVWLQVFQKMIFTIAIKSFEGTSKRLQKMKENSKSGVIYLDFAHSPSKVKATVDAISLQDIPGRPDYCDAWNCILFQV